MARGEERTRMFKVILILAAIALLALSAELSRARSGPLSLESNQVADLGFTGGEEGAGSTGLAILAPPGRALDAAVPPAERLSQAATAQPAGGEDNRPATALLLYGALIVIGSVVGVGLARRVQRELQ
jgi:hypothetical protein